MKILSIIRSLNFFHTETWISQCTLLWLHQALGKAEGISNNRAAPALSSLAAFSFPPDDSTESRLDFAINLVMNLPMFVAWGE